MVVNKKGKYIHHFQHIYIYMYPLFQATKQSYGNLPLQDSNTCPRDHYSSALLPPPPKHTVVRSKKVLIP